MKKYFLTLLIIALCEISFTQSVYLGGGYQWNPYRSNPYVEAGYSQNLNWEAGISVGFGPFGNGKESGYNGNGICYPYLMEYLPGYYSTTPQSSRYFASFSGMEYGMYFRKFIFIHKMKKQNVFFISGRAAFSLSNIKFKGRYELYSVTSETVYHEFYECNFNSLGISMAPETAFRWKKKIELGSRLNLMFYFPFDKNGMIYGTSEYNPFSGSWFLGEAYFRYYF